MLIYQNGTSYAGGDGFDAFYADLSAESYNVNWVNDGSEKTLVSQGNTFTVSGVERLLLQTGSGNDFIDNTANNSGEDIRTGAGDDVIRVGDGSDNIDAGNGNNIVYAGAGYNTVKTGTGSDRIDLTGGVVDAGAGDDQIAFHFISSGWHAVNGGEGDDSLSLDVYSSNRISLGDASGVFFVDLFMDTGLDVIKNGLAQAGAYQYVYDYWNNGGGITVSNVEHLKVITFKCSTLLTVIPPPLFQ